jgi:hypothetical protein
MGNANGTDTQHGTELRPPQYVTMDYHQGIKWTRSNNESSSSFFFSRTSDTKLLTENSAGWLGATLNDFQKRSNGLVGSRTVIFCTETKIGQGDISRTLRMKFTGTSRSFLSGPPRYWQGISVSRCLQLVDSSKRIRDSKNPQEDGSLMT